LNILSNKIHIERDLTTRNLEAVLMAKMAEIVKPEEPVSRTSNVKFVSVEDAIKELIELEKNRPGE